MSRQRLIPGYVSQTLSLAKAAGLKAWLDDQDDDNEDDCKRIVCKILGTQNRLRTAKFVTKKFKFPLRGAKSEPHPFNGWVERVKQSDEFLFTKKWTAPIEITRDPRYAVERLTFADIEDDNRLVHCTGFWGSPANVERVAGLRAGRLSRPRAPRASKEFYERSGGHWFAEYFPNGAVRCIVKTRERTADDVRRENASRAQSTRELPKKKIAVVDAKGNPSVLPDYILDRNRLALAAGLTIERQDIKDGSLTTWYRGTEAQWRASPFCHREEPFTKAPMYGFYCFSPARGWYFKVALRPDKGDYRGSMPRERLPERTEKIGDGITLYTMPAGQVILHDRGPYSVYVGEGQALVDWKIAPAEILHNKGRHDRADVKTANGSVTVWERELLSDGRCAFFDFGMPNVDELKLKRSFARPSELTANWAGFVQNALAIGEEEYARAKGPSGKRFAVTTDSLKTIREVARELLETILCASVVTRDALPPPKIVHPPWRSKAAKDDPKFQELLAGLSSGTPPKD